MIIHLLIIVSTMKIKEKIRIIVIVSMVLIAGCMKDLVKPISVNPYVIPAHTTMQVKVTPVIKSDYILLAGSAITST